MSDIVITTLAERPELAGRLWDMADSWPEFVQHDALAWLLYPRMVAEFPEYVLIATDGDVVVARGFSLPFAQHAPGSVAVDRQGQGLSGLMLAAMRDNARARGFAEAVAPVRPSAKSAEPDTSIHEYAYRKREDGLPHDPWLRVHVRAGGVVDSVAPLSMTVNGSLDQWRAWTGLPFDVPGPVHVPGALTPVDCAPEQGYAVYVEPNVWVRHSLV
ncbi:N-acetyltransferase [Streptomyces sp. NPDC054797]